MSVSDNADLTSAASTTEHLAEIGQKASRGLAWSLLGAAVTKVGSFALGLVMARLLSPADFGAYAVAVAAAAFAMYVNDVGVIAACVQWRGKFEEVVPTATVLAVVSSLLAYAMIFVCAPSFAALSGVPEAAPMVRLLCLLIVVDGITAVRNSALMRRFEQDRLTKANVIGWLANAAVTLPMAFAGAGAYSFVYGQLAGAIVVSAIVFKMANVPVKVGLDRQITKRLLTFGVPWAATLAIEAVVFNADFLIVGNALGAIALGYYMLAFNLSSWVPGLVGTAVRYVALPSFSRLAEHDPHALELGFRRSLPIFIAGVLPFAVVMATLAPQLIGFLYGDKWIPAAAVLRFLAALMVVRMLTTFAVDILASLGLTRATTWLNAGWAVALIPALWIGTQFGGIQGAAIAHSMVAVLVALPLTVLALHRAGLRLAPTLPALARPVMSAIAAAAVIVLIVTFVRVNSFVQLILAGGVGMLAYVVLVVPIHQFRQVRMRLTRVR